MKEQRKWPRYPLTAPWPTLTLLAENNQPLREREERWLAFRDRGEFRGYGEYIGSVAQQFDMQSARRIKDYPFTYGTIQMMLKDGGVCGTMANIAVRSHCTLGTPASTAGQPGHCALVLFAFDPKTGAYRCHGAQYATAGDAGTGVHAAWVFGDVDARRPMVYHQSIAWSVNHGLQSYLDSTVAHTFFKQLSTPTRNSTACASCKAPPPFVPTTSFSPDDALTTGIDPNALVAFWKTLKPAISEAPLRHHDEGQTLRPSRRAPRSRRRRPSQRHPRLPPRRAMQQPIRARRLQSSPSTACLPCWPRRKPPSRTTSPPRAPTPPVPRWPTPSPPRPARSPTRSSVPWALDRWQEIQGKEKYFGHKRRHHYRHIRRRPGQARRPKAAPRERPIPILLDQITQPAETELAAPRTPRSCKQLAGTITITAKQIKDETQKRQWARNPRQDHRRQGAVPDPSEEEDPNAPRSLCRRHCAIAEGTRVEIEKSRPEDTRCRPSVFSIQSSVFTIHSSCSRRPIGLTSPSRRHRLTAEYLV